MYGNNIIWINGINQAKAYQLRPGTSVLLMDADQEGIFYIKTCDNIGMVNLRIFKYEETVENKSEYVTKTELEEIIRRVLNEQSIPTNESNE